MENIHVDLSRVGLRGRDFGFLETGLLRYELVQALNLLVVAFEDGKETGLGSSSALDATETVEEIVPSTLDILQVIEKVSDPQAGALAHCNELSWLAVCVSQAR